MTIENKPTYFGRLELREIPADTGKDMLEPASLSVDFPSKTNNIAVFPDANRAYYFNLAPNAPAGYSRLNSVLLRIETRRRKSWHCQNFFGFD